MLTVIYSDIKIIPLCYFVHRTRGKAQNVTQKEATSFVFKLSTESKQQISLHSFEILNYNLESSVCRFE